MSDRKTFLAALATLFLSAGCNSIQSRSDNAEIPQKKEAAAAEPGKPAAKTISFRIAFKTHLEMDLPEQDVFIEREAGKVYRVTKGDHDMNAPLFKTAIPVRHDPFDPAAIGPHPKGEPLDMTLGQWLKHRGTGTYTYQDGVGTLKLKFAGLVPNGVYTMWHAFMALPPTTPFSGVLDLPLGARDGSESVFTADKGGNAEFVHSFRPGLQMSDTWTTSLLAIAYHSDSRTYGGVPGPFGQHTHVPLFVMLPKREGLD